MMKKLGTLISTICIINLLMLVGLGGFLWGTGRLNKPKAQTIADMLRQPGSPEGLRTKVYEIMASPTTQAAQSRPTSGPATATSLTGLEPATAQERIDYLQKVLEAERLRLESEAQKLREEQELLVAKQNQLDLERKTLADQKKAYEQMVAGATTKSDATGFQKSMEIFDQLKPKQVKDLLMTMPADQIARYITAMEPDRAAKVVGEFKSTGEKDILKEALDRVRGVTTAPGTSAASTQPAGPSAVVAGGPVP
jgi:flagellar motility protein MotE (MotC chaperone)